MTVERVGNERIPIKGRYIHMISPAAGVGTIKLQELQVFGSGQHTPEKNPVAVCDVTRNDDWFQAKVFSTPLNDFVWVDVAGNLDWIPDGTPTDNEKCPASGGNSPQVRELGILAGQSLNGAGAASWEMENTFITSLESSSSISHSSRVGAELDVSAGAVLQIQAGGGYEVSTGVGRTDSSELYWGKSLNFGGKIPGISNADFGAACDYMARPFAYRAPFYANVGFEHRALMIDYIVETRSWQHGSVPAICYQTAPPSATIYDDGFED